MVFRRTQVNSKGIKMSKNSLILLPKKILFLQPKTPEIQALKEYLKENSYEIIYWDNPNPYKLKEYLFQVRIV